MDAREKPLVWLKGEVKTPPFSAATRLETGLLLRRLQRGEMLSMPVSRPCAQQGVSLAGERPAAPSQGGCVDKMPGETGGLGARRPEEGRVSIARWNPKGLRQTSGP